MAKGGGQKRLTCKLPRVQFSVVTADNTETPYEGTYQVLDNAVLVVHPDDDNQPTIRLSPAFWRQIIEPRQHYEILKSVD